MPWPSPPCLIPGLPFSMRPGACLLHNPAPHLTWQAPVRKWVAYHPRPGGEMPLQRAQLRHAQHLQLRNCEPRDSCPCWCHCSGREAGPQRGRKPSQPQSRGPDRNSPREKKKRAMEREVGAGAHFRVSKKKERVDSRVSKGEANLMGAE